MKEIGKVVLSVVAILVLLRQFRKPMWGAGRVFLWDMNAKHAGVTNWGLSQLPLEKHFTILDVGCGGGRTIGTLAAIASDGKVYGIDYSHESVVTSRRTNAGAIAAGRVDVGQAAVSSLPFPDGTFDLVSAVETHYYWPNLLGGLREILRVLKPGGRVVVIAETYKGMRSELPYRLAMALLRGRFLSISEHREMLIAAGYADVEVFEERPKGWICAVGRRPA